MLTDERLELGNELRVAAEREVGIDPQLERGEARSLEALGLRLRENVVGELGERLAAPEAERLAEQPARPGGIGAFRLGDQPLEAEQVELVGVDPDEVAGLLRDDRRAVPEHLPQLGDVELERVRRGRRRIVRPQRVDQAVDRDGRGWASAGAGRAAFAAWRRPAARARPRPRLRAAPGSGTPSLALRHHYEPAPRPQERLSRGLSAAGVGLLPRQRAWTSPRPLTSAPTSSATGSRS